MGIYFCLYSWSLQHSSIRVGELLSRRFWTSEACVPREKPGGICTVFSNLASQVNTVTKAHSVSRGGDRPHLLMRGAPENLQMCFQTNTGFHRPLAESLGQDNESFTNPQIGSLWVPLCRGGRVLSKNGLPGLASVLTLPESGARSKSPCLCFLIHELG